MFGSIKPILSLALVAVLIGLLTGCETTDDPRKGGLFSYNPEAYEKRLQDRQTKLGQLEEEKKQEQAKTEQLEQQTAAKRAERDALAKKVAAMDQDIAGLEKKVAATKTATKKAAQEKWRIETKLRAVKRELAKVQGDSSMDQTAKEEELKRLQKRIDQLLQEAEELSTM